MRILSHKPLHVWCTGGLTYVWTPEVYLLHSGEQYRLSTTYHGDEQYGETTKIPGDDHELFLLFLEDQKEVYVVEDLESDPVLDEDWEDTGYEVVHYATVTPSSIKILEEQYVCPPDAFNSQE